MLTRLLQHQPKLNTHSYQKTSLLIDVDTMNTQDPQYAMDQSWLDDYVSVESHEDCEDDAVSVDDPRSDNHTFSLNDTVLENYAPVYVSNMAQQVRPVWNYNSILYQPPVYHGPSMNDGSSLFATSPAMEYLRGSNTSMGLYPYATLSPARPSRLLLTSSSPPEEHNTSSMLPVSNSTATHALHANFPGPVQQVAPSTVVQGSVSMSDGNKRPSLHFSTHS